MHNVRVIPPPGNRLRRGLRASRCRDPNKQAVRRVLDDRVEVDIGTDAQVIGREQRVSLIPRAVEIPLGETVRIGRNRGVRALRDLVERNGRRRFAQADRIDDLLLTVHLHVAAAIAEVTVIDVIEENSMLVPEEPLLGAVQVVADLNPAPVASRGSGHQRIGVHAGLLVLKRREDHAAFGSAQYLDRARRVVLGQRRTAHSNPRVLQLEDRAGIDHHRDLLGNDQLGPVRQHVVDQVAQTDFEGPVVAQRVEILIQTAIAHHSNDVARHGIGRRVSQAAIGRVERA